MKVSYLASIVFLISTSIYAQNTLKLKEYTASNGVTYKIDDDIKLGRGSDTNGRFVYVNMGGWYQYAAASSNSNYNANNNRLPASNTGLIVTIKKIKKYNYKRYKGVFFTVGGGNITNYVIDIENAIATCEVENCKIEDDKVVNVPKRDIYDELRKLKELHKDGIITDEEYEKEKKELLEKN